MSILREVRTKVVDFFDHLNKNPMETIETVISIALCLFAITVALPLELVPVASAYDNNFVKLLFGILIGFAPTRLLFWRVRHGIDKYILVYQARRQKMLFISSLTWLYLGALRIIIAPWYPPFYIMYLALFIIGIICYVRLYK